MRFATSFAALAFLVIGVCLASPVSLAISGWAGQATAHFAIFTTDNNSGGRELLERLERARLYFEKTGWAARDLKRPLSIMAFSSEKEFDAYRPNPGAIAFYQHTREGDYILLRSLKPEHVSIIVHEYTHFIVQHSGLKLPLWLNEGLADFYSTIESRQAQVIVGTAPLGWPDTLHNHSWMDWHTLTAVDQQSPYYRQPDKMLLFYSQSWAFVHFLALDNAYENKFRGFLGTISAGSDSGGPFEATYHKTLQDLGSETEQDVRAKRLESRLVELDIRPGTLNVAEVADSGQQAELALANVQAANPRAAAEAKMRLEVLAAKYPDDPRAEESLGFLSMRTGLKNSEAEQHFERASKAHSNDPEVLFWLAHLKLERGGSADEAIDLLRRALISDGTYYSALLELGFAAANSDRFDLAVEALGKISKPHAEDAFGVSYLLAYSLSELHLNNRARTSADQAQKMAGNPRERQQVADLLAEIEQESKGEEATK